MYIDGMKQSFKSVLMEKDAEMLRREIKGLKTYCTFQGKRMLLADAREAANRHFDTTGVVAAIEYCKEKLA